MLYESNASINHKLNNLAVGTILQQNGYQNDKYVIVKNKGINSNFPSWGARYETISLRTYVRSLHDAYTLKHISEKKDDRICTYVTDEMLSIDDTLDIINKEKEQVIKDAKEKEIQETKKQEEIERLKKEYSHLLPCKDSGKSSVVIAAKNIRIELKKAFPKVKFSVTSKSYSMGNSIDVSWSDGPTTQSVDKIINKYEAGWFDGMTDCYDYYQNNLFGDLFGDAKYVHSSRNISIESFNLVARGLGYKDVTFNMNTGSFDGVDYEIGEMIKRTAYKLSF